ncbi:indole-3-acetic acid-induced protein ARG2 [Cajanus cajan]|uniref:Indole-3-acetic acid-induced protein ARG2 n=1 Tax=Cajanus cajan TaxID=3821 RepID=A0A151U4L6_CAJCA|nr:indole-3-acetic acid-induced protein ARG2 [Cajanus cajan]KYP74243.1 Indole-3-acetic acid-induced protein ARG2 [Cajanus cajan]
MARSFSNVKVLSALVADGLSNTLTRRGYAAATQSATRGGGGSISGKIAPKSGEDKVGGAEKVSWVPDPVTGYYKPENTKEIDVAELRATLMRKKFNH